MKIRQYISNSLSKLRNDALSKMSYDILKYSVIAIFIWSGLTLMAIWVNFLKFLFINVTTPIWIIILAVLMLIVLVTTIINVRHKKQLNDLINDNHKDELTGLKNHKALREHLSHSIERCNGTNLSLILIDVDDFKKFNSETSHTIADNVLNKLGELLDRDRRVTDETFRYFLRGDEFMVIANETNQHQAFLAAERKRKLINNHVFEVDGEIYKVTVSCGVTEVNPNDNYESFTSRVSIALNVAKKEKGKNCSKSLN